MLLDYQALRATGRRPRLHPNGFIQLNLNLRGTERLHVWPDKPVQAQKTRHTIHDHAFAMESTLLLGVLTNREFEFVEVTNAHASYGLYQAKQISSDDTVLVFTGRRGHLKVSNEGTYSAGQTYRMLSEVLHDSVPGAGLVATYMRKTTTYADYRPLIAVPLNVEPDNEFRRETEDAEFLWDFIRRVTERLEMRVAA